MPVCNRQKRLGSENAPELIDLAARLYSMPNQSDSDDLDLIAALLKDVWTLYRCGCDLVNDCVPALDALAQRISETEGPVTRYEVLIWAVGRIEIAEHGKILPILIGLEQTTFGLSVGRRLEAAAPEFSCNNGKGYRNGESLRRARRHGENLVTRVICELTSALTMLAERQQLTSFWRPPAIYRAELPPREERRTRSRVYKRQYILIVPKGSRMLRLPGREIEQ